MIVTPDGLAFDDGTLLTSTELKALDAIGGNMAVLAALTASAAELNKLTGLATTALELGKLSGAPFLVTQVSTPASGSNVTQFTFKNAAGTAVAVPVSGTFYLSSDSAGATPIQPTTSIVALTNGAIASRGATASKGPFYDYTTTAAGLLGITLTAAAGSWYVNFVLPNGKLINSTVLTVS